MTDQTDRDRIITALYDARRHGLGGMSEAEAVGHMADAVLAALPAVSSAGPAPATDRDGLPPEATWMFGAAEIETRPEMNVTPLPAGALAADETVAPATDRDTLRERIAEELWTAAERDIVAEWICCYPVNPNHDLCSQGAATLRMVRSLIFDGDRTLADAVLAVLPAPTDQTAVLLEAADIAEDVALRLRGECLLDQVNGAYEVMSELRRRAGEAQQDEPVVTVHAAPNLSPEAQEALGALVDVAKRQFDCDFDHPHPKHPCGRHVREARQDPTQDGEAEAHPPLNAWRVETRDPLANEWAPGSHFRSRPHAVERYETANSTAPLWRDGTPVERRIVRETTTYTVEQPADTVRPGQPETDGEPTP